MSRHASQRPRPLLARLLGERAMLAVARWVAGPLYTVNLGAVNEALGEAVTLAIRGEQDQRRKRRRLLTRLCQERGYDRLLAASRGLTHYRRNTPIVTDPAAYQPADHCELSGTTPREEAL